MEKIFKQIGLAYRAQSVVLGTDKIIHLSKKGKINLVIISIRTSSNTRKLIQDKLSNTEIPIVIVDDYDNEELSKSLGRENVKVIAIKDEGFSNNILKTIRGE